MRAWWDRLNARERWLVGGGAGLVALLMLYALVWQPFQGELGRLRQTVAEERAQVAWMRQAAVEVKRLSAVADGSPARAAGGDGRSLLTLVDQTARSAGLGTAVKRVEPQGSDRLTVRLEQASFDDMIRWLDGIERDYGIQTVNGVFDREADSGRVNARLILQGAAR